MSKLASDPLSLPLTDISSRDSVMSFVGYDYLKQKEEKLADWSYVGQETDF